MFVQEWLGVQNGHTYNEQTLQFNFNDDYTRWNSGDNTPQWFFWYLVTNGENVGDCSTFEYNGGKYKPGKICIRNVGITGKCRISGKIIKKIGDGPWQFLS